MAFPLIVTESDILPIDIPVASLQLSDQLAFGYLPVPQQTVWTDIVGKRGKKQAILPELPEHCAELSAGARPPAASSWYVPNTFRPAKVCAHIPRMGNVFPSASPQRISCSTPPSQMVADGRLPPARPFPLGG